VPLPVGTPAAPAGALKHLTEESAVPLPTTISPACLETIVGLLMPMLREAAGGDEDAARALALDILEQYEPRTSKELLEAGEAAAFKLVQIRLQMEAMESGLSDKERQSLLRQASMLGRSSRDAHGWLRRSQAKR